MNGNPHHAADIGVRLPRLAFAVLAGAVIRAASVSDKTVEQTAMTRMNATKEVGRDHAVHILAIAESRDRQAFAALFTHFAPRIKSYLMRLGTPSEAAEDLAQEAMIRVWRKAAQFDPARAEAATWIFSIARNLRIDALRRERYPEAPEQVLETLADEAMGADERVAMRQRATIIRAAMKTLPEEQAEVIRLSFFADKPHAAIAEELGIPLGTVKSRMRLGIKRIRSLLGDDGP